MDTNNPTDSITTEAEFEAWRNSQWQLAEVLSNARLEDQGNTFTVEQKVADGNITYKLPLNDFLGIDENKTTATRGKGFYDSPLTKDVRQDETDLYTIKYEARADAAANDWTTETCNLRAHLKLNHGILFGGDDAAPAMIIVKNEAEEGATTYEVSPTQARNLVKYTEEEKNWGEEGEAEQTSDPDHKVVFQPKNQGVVVINGLFGDGVKVGKFISLLMDGNPHPGGKMTYRTDAKGHRYYGCEKHEHDVHKGTWKNICT